MPHPEPRAYKMQHCFEIKERPYYSQVSATEVNSQPNSLEQDNGNAEFNKGLIN